MNVPSCPRWPVTVGTVGLGYALVWHLHSTLAPWVVQVSVIGLGYGFLWCTSGYLVDFVLAWAEGQPERRGRGGRSGVDEDASPDGGREEATEPVTADPSNGVPTTGAGAAPAPDDAVSEQDRDVGTIVGKAENVLLPTFILAEAYTALSVIFAAKGLVRREDIRKDTLYYLGCTMTNVTYSVAVGLAVRVSLEALGVGQIAFL